MPPISTIGFGRTEVSSPRRVPKPPARITACIEIRPCVPVNLFQHTTHWSFSTPHRSANSLDDWTEAERLINEADTDVM